MARSIRIQLAGVFYHVMACDNHRDVIFHDDDDRRFFLLTGMSWLQNTLTRHCNVRHRQWGRLFGDPEAEGTAISGL
jgi:putative transposase